MMDTRRCLEILEIESVTSPEELKQAYRDLTQIWHPDRFQGNPRLQNIATAKLKDINEAYNHLLGYFDPEQRKHLKGSDFQYHDPLSGFEERPRHENRTSDRTRDFSNFENERDRINRNSPGNFKIYRAPKKSFLGRFVGLLVLCIFLVISGLVVYFVLNMERLTAGSMSVASEAMEKMKNKLEAEMIDQLEKKGKLPPGTIKPKSDITDQKKNTKPDKPLKIFEIHLEGDTILMTRSWWQEGDMIMYTQFGGSMGVEKSRVKKIVEREAKGSDLPF